MGSVKAVPMIDSDERGSVKWESTAHKSIVIVSPSGISCIEHSDESDSLQYQYKGTIKLQ